jgi:hypothetical protein
MRVVLLAVMGVLGVARLLGSSPATIVRASPSVPSVNDVAWMAGCWTGQRGETRFHETWIKASEDLMLGVSYTIGAKGKVQEFEFLRIAVRQERLAYLAQPNGRPETVFELQQDAEDRKAIFANLTHDFPKRVIYEQTPTGLLAAIDDGTSNKRIEFPMTRAPCDRR